MPKRDRSVVAGNVLPPIMFLRGTMELDQAKTTMLVATLVWFVATALWMDQKPEGRGAGDGGNAP